MFVHYVKTVKFVHDIKVLCDLLVIGEEWEISNSFFLAIFLYSVP